MTPSTYNPFVFNSWSCWPRYPRIIHRLVFAESHCNNKSINLAYVNRSITENVLHQKVTVSSFACQFWKTFFHSCVDHVHLLWMSQNQARISPMLSASGWFRPGSGTSWLVCTGSGLLWHVHIRILAISASVSGSSESESESPMLFSIELEADGAMQADLVVDQPLSVVSVIDLGQDWSPTLSTWSPGWSPLPLPW